MTANILYKTHFIENPQELYNWLVKSITWDERMYARKTASFGDAYNYSQIAYPYQEFPQELQNILDKLETTLGFRPTNCLLNYYLNGESKMGFHSDQIDILEKHTGVAIVSVGEPRILRFKEITDHSNQHDYLLENGSLIYMDQDVQKQWLHAIPKTNSDKGRISLTFRAIKK